MAYLLHLIVLVEIYAILAISFELIAGQAGMFSIAHASFFGLGAYSSAIASLHLKTSFFPGLLIGILLAAFISLIVCFASARLHDDYFTISTFGLQTILFSLFQNLPLTRGPLGIPGIPKMSLLGITIESYPEHIVTCGLFLALFVILISLIIRSPFGRVLRGIREDEIFCQSLGKDTAKTKLIAMCVSASVAAVAGSLYAHYLSFVDPTSFSVSESILIISMIVVGGAGRLRGALLGTVVLLLLPELLRFIGLGGPSAANLRQIIYGLLLVLSVLFRPRGLIGKFKIQGAGS